MPYINEHTVMGHLGKDPEIRYVGNGTAVCGFSIATTERWKDKQSGQQQEKTSWHNIVVWGKPAEQAAEHLRKGDLCLVKGPSETRKWEDKNGNDRYTTEIKVTRFDQLKIFNWRKDGSGAPPQQQPGNQTPPPHGDEGFNDDIPF